MTSSEKHPNNEAPKDKFFIVYILFFFMGLVYLLPWTFFTTATEFWMYKFRNTSENNITNPEDRTQLQAQFNSILLIALQISEVVFLFVGLIVGESFNVKTRLIGIISLVLLLFITLTIFVKIDTDEWQFGYFVLVILCAGGINALNAIFSSALFTTVSQFPQSYLGSYMTGCGISRVFTACLQLLSLGTGLSLEDSALVYFSLGLIIISWTLLVVIYATNYSQFYLYHIKNYQTNTEKKHVSLKRGWFILKKIWSPVTMNGLFLITFNATPTALVASENVQAGPWNEIYFIPTITFLLSAVCELIGRSIGYKINLNLSSALWATVCLIRMVIFVPLFILCNAQPRHHLPVVFPHDYQYIIIIIVASLTGGYILTRCNYNIKELVTDEELKDAYHVNMIMNGLEMGTLSFFGSLTVNIL